jgi:hypothetical protein
MRVSRSQASEAFATVRRRHRRASTRRRRVRPAPSLTTVATPLAVERALATIADLPPARSHMVEAAVARLAAGQRPSSYAIADMAIRHAGVDMPV